MSVSEINKNYDNIVIQTENKIENNNIVAIENGAVARGVNRKSVENTSSNSSYSFYEKEICPCSFKMAKNLFCKSRRILNDSHHIRELIIKVERMIREQNGRLSFLEKLQILDTDFYIPLISKCNETITGLKALLKNFFEKLEDLQAMRDGDINTAMNANHLYISLFKPEHRDEVTRLQLGRRNVIQGEEILNFLETHPREQGFIVNGMAHLFDYESSEGLISFLRKNNYVVEQIN